MLDLLGKLVDPVSNILDKVVEDKDQKAKLAHEIATMAERHAQELGLPVTLFITGWFDLQHPPLPEFDMQSLMTVLLGMLGLGGMRTFEKFKGVTK